MVYTYPTSMQTVGYALEESLGKCHRPLSRPARAVLRLHDEPNFPHPRGPPTWQDTHSLHQCSALRGLVLSFAAAALGLTDDETSPRSSAADGPTP